MYSLTMTLQLHLTAQQYMIGQQMTANVMKCRLLLLHDVKTGFNRNYSCPSVCPSRIPGIMTYVVNFN